MRLVIEQTEEYDMDFILWLINMIKIEFLGSVKYSKLIKFNNYLKKLLYDKIDNKNIANSINVSDAVKAGICSLRVRVISKHYVIDINPNIVLPRVKMNVKKLCKFVNYGTSDLKGYPVFDNIFIKVKNNLESYYERYLIDIE